MRRGRVSGGAAWTIATGSSQSHAILPVEFGAVLAHPDAPTVPELAGVPPRRRYLVPVVVVGLVCLANLVLLRTELVAAAPANASGRNMAMVRVATADWEAGRVPLDPWLPWQNTGAAMFHQSESTPARITGLLGALTGPDTAYRVLLYLLLALWPAALYLAATVARLDRRVALAAAVLAPLVVSVSGTGYELAAYVWAGRGWFTQLWGMWALPFAWATAWRSLHGRLNPAWAVAAGAATLMLHVGTWPFLAVGVVVCAAVDGRAGAPRRAVRLAVVVGATLAVAASFLVPLLGWISWSNASEYLRRIATIEGVGFWRALWNLVAGECYDAGRVPVLTALVAVGVVVCARRVRTHAGARAALALWAGSLLVYATWTWWHPWFGSLAGGTGSTPPQSIVGVHLSGLVLAATGAEWLFGAATRLLGERAPGIAPAAAATVLAACAVVVLAPAWVERVAYALDAGNLVQAQHTSDRVQGAAVAELLDAARARGPGRVYAGGLVRNRPDVVVGRVPLPAWAVYAGADVIGDLLQTSGLAADPEAQIDPDDPGQLTLYGVRYVIDSGNRTPPFPVVEVASRPGLELWEVSGDSGYTRTIDGLGPPIEADRADLGSAVLHALEKGNSLTRLRTIAYDGAPAGPDTISGMAVPAGGPGRIVTADADPEHGHFGALVDMTRRGYVVAAASVHGRWRVAVDGVDTETDVLAPAFPAVSVDTGRHTVTFDYEPLTAWTAWPAVAGLVILCGVAAVFGRPRSRREVVEGPRHGVGLPREV